MRIAEQYIHAFSKIAKEVTTCCTKKQRPVLSLLEFLYVVNFCCFFQGTTLLLPSSTADPASMMAQALSIYKNLIGNGLRYTDHRASSGSTDENKDDVSSKHSNESLESDSSTMTYNPYPGDVAFTLQSHKKDTN